MKIMTGYIFKSKSVDNKVASEPPVDFKKVHNIYIEPTSGKLVVIHDE